jgi:hypothetical protein
MMATPTAQVIDFDRDAIGTATRASDRWIYVFTAALFVLVALGGFVPDSVGLLAAVRTGQRPPLPDVLHVHAVLMGSWLLLLLAQTCLMATGQRRLHMKLGVAAVLLVPLMLIAGSGLVIGTFRGIWAAAAAPGVDPGALAPVKGMLTNLLLGQIRTGVLFPIFVAWALLVRKKDSGMHKRLMILATVIPLQAGSDRLVTLLGLPSTTPASPLSIDLYSLALLLPMFLHDVFRYKRVHRAYLVWLALYIPATVAMNWLWQSPWWMTTAPKLMGVQG